MDCGAAALKCLFEGFGIQVSYGRLRDACQTSIDGTSIDAVEDVANLLGLEAEQVMVPADHLFIPEARILPAVVVVREASGFTHFVVVWSRHGDRLQMMDPAIGRRWPASGHMARDLYLHETAVPAQGFCEWTRTEEFGAAMHARLQRLGLGPDAAEQLLNTASSGLGWRPVAVLDAAVRVADRLVRTGGIVSGVEAKRLVEALWHRELGRAAAREAVAGGWETQGAGPASEVSVAPSIIPHRFWTVRAASPAGGEEQLIMRGIVAVRVRGVRETGVRETAPGPAGDDSGEPTSLPVELAQAVAERPVRPLGEIGRVLRAGGLLAPSAVIAALVVAAAGVTLEAVLLRGILDLGALLEPPIQRLLAIGAVLLLSAVLLAHEVPAAAGLLRLGRQLEVRLRADLLAKLPRIPDRYFQSRLVSDMVERAHRIAVLHALPDLGGQILRTGFALVFTTAGILWLDPRSGPLAIFAAMAGAAIPLAAGSLLAERDLKVRNQAGALTRFYLEGLLGLIPIRAHGAERSLCRAHEHLLARWVQSSFTLQRGVVLVQGLQSVAGLGLTAWLILAYVARGTDPANLLLLAYWSLQLPILGQRMAFLLRQYPESRSVTLRLLEPLGAVEAGRAGETQGKASEAGRAGEAAGAVEAGKTVEAGEPAEVEPGVAIRFESVAVCAGGHLILSDIDLDISAGTHVAVLGPSGAGKSTLAGTLIGLYEAAGGQLKIDGFPLTAERMPALRRRTAWVDPGARLWNISLLDNLTYGAPRNGLEGAFDAAEAVADLNLDPMLDRLTDGMRTILGENGGLVAGGEGQRVRLGRAWLRRHARLVILDEPFRGVDRALRRDLLARARRRWPHATLIAVTHDVEETLGFDRIVMLEAGRICEQGRPDQLASDPNSHYGALLRAADRARREFAGAASWRRFWLEEGMLCADRENRG
jgi:ATP-binding cassette subfamily B protein